MSRLSSLHSGSAVRLCCRLWFCVLVIGLYVHPVFAQSMSFSVYTNATAGYGNVNISGSVLDNSTGCSHSGYSTTATISSPSSRGASSTGSGLSASASLAIDGEFGTYSMTVTGSYQCSCIGGGRAGYGGAQSLPVPRPTYAQPYNWSTESGTPNGCSSAPYYWFVRDYQVRDQANQDISRVMPLTETMSNQSPNCFNINLFVTGGGNTTNQGRWRDNLYLCNSPTCNNGGSCTLTRDQTWTADGQTLSPTFTQTYSCSTASVTP